MEKRHSRMRGIGREFESLREYREGDEYRDICWTAAARRGKLVTRIYQIERSQVDMDRDRFRPPDASPHRALQQT